MSVYCYLNGHFIDEKHATIHIQDRGFRFGDGVFETIAVYRGIPYQWQLHRERLEAGLTALNIPCDIRTLDMVIFKLIEKNGLKDATIRISVTRGVGSQGYLPTGAADPTILVETAPRHAHPVDGANLWLSDVEKPSLKALPVNCKLSQGVNSTLARMQAAEHGCIDALQLNADQEICETSSANIFWLKDDVLYTPELECGVLAGTTRNAILRISPYLVEEGRFHLADLETAEAVVLTNTNWQVLPIDEMMPNGWQWDRSVPLAKELREALTHDILNYALKRTS